MAGGAGDDQSALAGDGGSGSDPAPAPRGVVTGPKDRALRRPPLPNRPLPGLRLLLVGAVSPRPDRADPSPGIGSFAGPSPPDRDQHRHLRHPPLGPGGLRRISRQ